MADSLDFKTISVGDLISEFEKAIPVLISAAEVAEKFSVFLPAPVKSTLDEAVKILTAVQAIAEKL